MSTPQILTGRVKRVWRQPEKTFAFITADDGTDYYVRKSEVAELKKGQHVAFRGITFSDGRTCATEIAVLDEASENDGPSAMDAQPNVTQTEG